MVNENSGHGEKKSMGKGLGEKQRDSSRENPGNNFRESHVENPENNFRESLGENPENNFRESLRKNLPFLMFLASLVLTAAIFAFSGHRRYIHSDGEFYYIPLPEIFIRKSLGPFVKYPLGTALMITPFFLLFHAAASLLAPELADGYSWIYQYSVAFAALIYCILAFIFLYRILLLYYRRRTCVLTCICIFFGSMLPAYLTQNASFSHVYAFAAVTVFLYLVVSGKDGAAPEKPSDPGRSGKASGLKYSFLLGIVSGIIFLIRNTDLCVLLLYLLFGCTNAGYRERLKRIFNPVRIAVNAAGFLLPASLQLIYWKLQTGSWLTNSYSGESFSFAKNPKLAELLFSDAKGLFIFCPVLILSLAGIFYAGRRSDVKAGKDSSQKQGSGIKDGEDGSHKPGSGIKAGEESFRKLRPAVKPGEDDLRKQGHGVKAGAGEVICSVSDALPACILILLFNIYIYAAWWCWWLGAAYGIRTFCDFLGIFAILMGAFFEHFAESATGYRRIIMRTIVYIIAALFVLDSCAFQYAAMMGRINRNLSGWHELHEAAENFYTAGYYREQHWWKIRNGENRFKITNGHFLSEFPQEGEGFFISQGEGWLLFGPYKELPAGSYRVTFHFALPDEETGSSKVPMSEPDTETIAGADALTERPSEGNDYEQTALTERPSEENDYEQTALTDRSSEENDYEQTGPTDRLSDENEDEILGTAGLNSNLGSFDPAEYKAQIRKDNLTVSLGPLFLDKACTDFELQVYANRAGLSVDELIIEKLE